MEWRVYWLDQERNPIDSYLISKPTQASAISSVARKMSQSPHLLPVGTAGFALVDQTEIILEERRRKNAEIAAYDAEMQQLAEKLDNNEI